MQIRKIGDDPLRKILKHLGGWPVTETVWNPPSFSIEYLLGHLRREYSESVLFEVYVSADDKNSSVHILQVSDLKHIYNNPNVYRSIHNRPYVSLYSFLIT